MDFQSVHSKFSRQDNWRSSFYLSLFEITATVSSNSALHQASSRIFIQSKHSFFERYKIFIQKIFLSFKIQNIFSKNICFSFKSRLFIQNIFIFYKRARNGQLLHGFVKIDTCIFLRKIVVWWRWWWWHMVMWCEVSILCPISCPMCSKPATGRSPAP